MYFKLLYCLYTTTSGRSLARITKVIDGWGEFTNIPESLSAEPISRVWHICRYYIQLQLLLIFGQLWLKPYHTFSGSRDTRRSNKYSAP